MSGFPPRRTSTRIHDAKRPFWLARLVQTLLIAAVSYFVAAFLFLLLARISQMPSGGVWDEWGLRAPLLFLSIVVVGCFLIVPYFQKDWDSGTRSLSLFSATFLIAYAVFHGTGLIDPAVPLEMFGHYVLDPIRRSLNF